MSPAIWLWGGAVYHSFPTRWRALEVFPLTYPAAALRHARCRFSAEDTTHEKAVKAALPPSWPGTRKVRRLNPYLFVYGSLGHFNPAASWPSDHRLPRKFLASPVPEKPDQ